MGSLQEPRGTRIEHEIVVDAPVERVWALIADVDGWSRWSTLYPAASGRLETGGTLDLSIALPGLKPQPSRATVVAVEPESAMRYLTVSFGGLVLGNRYMTVRAVGTGRCAVINGEVIGGLLGPLIARLMRAKVAEGFAVMNAELKAQAETSPRN
jgi:hypothetical protein